MTSNRQNVGMKIPRPQNFLLALLLAFSLPLAAQTAPTDAHLEHQVTRLLDAQPALRGVRA